MFAGSMGVAAMVGMGHRGGGGGYAFIDHHHCGVIGHGHAIPAAPPAPANYTLNPMQNAYPLNPPQHLAPVPLVGIPGASPFPSYPYEFSPVQAVTSSTTEVSHLPPAYSLNPLQDYASEPAPLSSTFSIPTDCNPPPYYPPPYYPPFDSAMPPQYNWFQTGSMTTATADCFLQSQPQPLQLTNSYAIPTAPPIPVSYQPPKPIDHRNQGLNQHHDPLHSCPRAKHNDVKLSAPSPSLQSVVPPNYKNSTNGERRLPFGKIDREQQQELIHLAACHGDLVALRSHAIDKRFDFAEPLKCAIIHGHVDVSRALIVEFGADIRYVDALCLAALDGQLDIVIMLVTELAGYFKKELLVCEALKGAAKNGHIDVVRWLIDFAGASILYASNSDGRDALMYASEGGRINVVKYLIEEKGANPNMQDNKGFTAFDWALSGSKSVSKTTKSELLDYLTEKMLNN